MIVAKIFFTILEVLFVAGMVGSAVVVILTSIEDAKELRPKKAEPKNTLNVLQHSSFEAQ